MRSARSELREFLEGLDEDEKAGLIALMWIGRETFAPEELPEAVRTARAERGERPDDYLIAEPQLADFLESGMEALGFSPRTRPRRSCVRSKPQILSQAWKNRPEGPVFLLRTGGFTCA
ncbi:DUF3775 domain-containing protein [Paracoccus cavernae]|uniref:DUF3775 domain-containing protein n=1 Tax=Paracoccus cavernae TaxID=1571207 RepID=A0ABT8D7V7_9RHOB|nr:DUF3775 domain-containing protein [Paracoccus cavernae]